MFLHRKIQFWRRQISQWTKAVRWWTAANRQTAIDWWSFGFMVSVCMRSRKSYVRTALWWTTPLSTSEKSSLKAIIVPYACVDVSVPGFVPRLPSTGCIITIINKSFCDAQISVVVLWIRLKTWVQPRGAGERRGWCWWWCPKPDLDQRGSLGGKWRQAWLPWWCNEVKCWCLLAACVRSLWCWQWILGFLRTLYWANLVIFTRVDLACA